MEEAGAGYTLARVEEDERTGADLDLFMVTLWGRWHEPPASEPPNLRAHFDRLLERPGVQRMMIAEVLT